MPKISAEGTTRVSYFILYLSFFVHIVKNLIILIDFNIQVVNQN